MLILNKTFCKYDTFDFVKSKDPFLVLLVNKKWAKHKGLLVTDPN